MKLMQACAELEDAAAMSLMDLMAYASTASQHQTCQHLLGQHSDTWVERDHQQVPIIGRTPREAPPPHEAQNQCS